MTPWLAILAVVGGFLAAFFGLRTLVELAWSPQPELQPRPHHLRVVEREHERVVEPRDP